MSKLFISFLALTMISIGLASASVSPGVSFHQPGSPFVSCGVGNSVNQPNGFLTAGFANAAVHYAGSPGTPSLEHGNPRAIAQYDVACYQFTQNH